MRRSLRVLASTLSLLAPLAPLGGCSFSSTSNQWHERVGPNGTPVYVKSHTKVGANFLIVIPFLGSTTLPKQIDELTEEIAAENGNKVRMVESSAENYWYGFPPFTWIITPVITTVAADYEPTTATLQKDREDREGREKEAGK